MTPRPFAFALAVAATSSLLCTAVAAEEPMEVDSNRQALSDSVLRYIPDPPPPAEGEEPVDKDVSEAEYRDMVNALIIGDGDGPGEELSEEQVGAMLHALHNTHENGLVPMIEPEDLKTIIDEDYGTKSIRAAVQGFEQEARFTDKAARFEADSDQASRALIKAGTEHDKFMAKAERHDAKAEAKELAKGQAREMARSEGRALGRDEAQHAMKSEKHESGSKGKALAKGKNK
jgi:hypothetical protein